MPNETVDAESAKQITDEIPEQRRPQKITKQRWQEHPVEIDFLDHGVTGLVDDAGVPGTAGRRNHCAAEAWPRCCTMPPRRGSEPRFHRAQESGGEPSRARKAACRNSADGAFRRSGPRAPQAHPAPTMLPPRAAPAAMCAAPGCGGQYEGQRGI